MADFNTEIIEEFRANDGKVGGMFEGAPMVILHTTGAKSGLKRETPLVYLNHEDKMFIFASKAGADTHPDWFHNIKADSSVSIEVGTDTVNKTAVILDEADRAATYAVQETHMPGFTDYRTGTDRVIPVIELT